MRNYCEVEMDLKRLLNSTCRNKKIKFVNLLKEFKQFNEMMLSTKFLFNLIGVGTNKQKRQQIRDLTRGIKKQGQKRAFVETDFIHHKTDIKEYGFNKLKEVVLKNIRTQSVGIEVISRKSENLKFINV